MSLSSSLIALLVLSLGTTIPCALHAQSSTQVSDLTYRKQQIVLDLVQVGVHFSASDPAAQPLRASIGDVRTWATERKAPPPKEAVVPELDDAMGKTFPNRWERWGRFHQFKVEGTEQPATVLAYATPTATTPTQINNPDHVLYRYTITTKALEFFPTTQDVADQAKAFLDAGGYKVGSNTKMLCRSRDDDSGPAPVGPPPPRQPTFDSTASCLSKTRKRDIFYRFVSGFTSTFSFSDNPEIVQNIDLRLDPTASNRELVSGEIVFDPVNVFLSGTDWKNVATAKDAYGSGVRASLKDKIQQKCPGIGGMGIDADHCLSRLAGPTGWGTRLAAMLLPTIDYKVQTQFDFIKNGAAFQAPITPFGHLYTFSLTEDFRRAFATGKQRNDALAAIVAFQKEKTVTDDRRVAVLADFNRLAMDDSRLNDDKFYQALLDKIAATL